MLRLQVPVDRIAELQAGGEHASVLAGTIALQWRASSLTQNHLRHLLLVGWKRSAALQRRIIKAELGKHGEHLLLMSQFGMVRSAAKGELRRRVAKPIGRTAFNNRNRLEWFRRRTIKGKRRRVARRRDYLPFCIRHGHHTLMYALHHPAPGRLRQQCRHLTLLVRIVRKPQSSFYQCQDMKHPAYKR